MTQKLVSLSIPFSNKSKYRKDYPFSKGPLIELYHAEEAIGLAKSLDWNIIKGPFWKKEMNKCNH